MTTAAVLKEVKARVDVLELTSDRKIRGSPFLCTPEEGELVRLALDAYAFCLNGEDAQWDRRITFDDFAKAIEKVYDCESPGVNMAVVRALRSVHSRMVAATAEGRMLRLPS